MLRCLLGGEMGEQTMKQSRSNSVQVPRPQSLTGLFVFEQRICMRHLVESETVRESKTVEGIMRIYINDEK